MSAPRLPVTRALVALIEKATGRPCGIGELPRVQMKSGAWGYQVTSVGERGDQVEWLADRVRDGVVGRRDGEWAYDLRIPQDRVIDRELDHDAGGEPSVSAAGAIVSYVQRFTITVTPT